MKDFNLEVLSIKDVGLEGFEVTDVVHLRKMPYRKSGYEKDRKLSIADVQVWRLMY